jgi:hypothetical protein
LSWKPQLRVQAEGLQHVPLVQETEPPQPPQSIMPPQPSLTIPH